MSEHEKPNFRWVKGGMYIVRTQAGFRQAGIDFCDGVEVFEEYTKQSFFEYPKSYPSVVFFSVGYAGYHYLRCQHMHVNLMKVELQDE